MENTALLILLESVLKNGTKTSKGNYTFFCPFCSHHKPKLEINLQTNEKKENYWHCWVCDASGKTIRGLFKKMQVPLEVSSNLNTIIVPSFENTKQEPSILKFPEEFISLADPFNLDRITQIEYRRALIYLKKRNLTRNDVLKYNIGFCTDGRYKGRIIIPSYDEKGKLNYFVARDYTETSYQPYDNPSFDSKNAIGFELYINWDAPIILVEGVFDAITIKRNAIPLFGKFLQEKLMKKLVKSSVNRIYIALDPDALKKSLQHAEKLMSYGKEVFLVELDGKDANQIGFERFLNTIEKVESLTFQTLLEKKLTLND